MPEQTLVERRHIINMLRSCRNISRASPYWDDRMRKGADAVIENVLLQLDFRNLDEAVAWAEEDWKAAEARAALSASNEGEETWESIAKWCEETFGPASPMRMASRANEEMAELIDVASRTESYSEKVLIEAADIVICLARFPGIWEAVERKMAINRSRTWRLTGEGTGYHIAAQSPSGDE